METEGHRLLRAWLNQDDHSQTALAKEIGLTQSAIAKWFKEGSETRPASAHRKAIRLVCGIPEPAWDTDEERALLARLTESCPATADAA